MILPKAILLVGLSAIAAAQTDSTTPPPSTKPLLTLRGEGVQIYTCKQTPTGPAWVFTAPQAKLFEGLAERGTHAAGPNWTLTDGSSIRGKLLATSPSPDPNAIPWLLLQAADARGTLAAVTHIRRSETHGGKAPNTGCDTIHLGTTGQVPYTAIYTFYASQ
jgi:hypothetical protein